MNVGELTSQLYHGQSVRVLDSNVFVLDEEGKVMTTYTIDPYGQLFPSCVTSRPPQGCHKVVNQYWDPTLQKVVVEIDTTPE